MRSVRMRVREIIKMHLDSGMIRLDTPVIIMDLPAGKKIEAGVMDPKVMEYMEYPYESVTVAKGKLRVAVNLLGNDMEDIQKTNRKRERRRSLWEKQSIKF